MWCPGLVNYIYGRERATNRSFPMLFTSKHCIFPLIYRFISASLDTTILPGVTADIRRIKREHVW